MVVQQLMKQLKKQSQNKIAISIILEIESLRFNRGDFFMQLGLQALVRYLINQFRLQVCVKLDLNLILEAKCGNYVSLREKYLGLF